MTMQSAVVRTDVERAQKLWLFVGIGALFYFLIHTLQTVFVGVPQGFSGKEHQGLWVFTVTLAILLLPLWLTLLGTSVYVAWCVFVTGLLGVLMAMLITWQYGIAAGTGYITLTVMLFMLVPQGLALWRTLQWARAKH